MQSKSISDVNAAIIYARQELLDSLMKSGVALPPELGNAGGEVMSSSENVPIEASRKRITKESDVVTSTKLSAGATTKETNDDLDQISGSSIRSISPSKEPRATSAKRSVQI